MLSAGNPYVLPSVLVAAVAYLALSLFTDLSVVVRIGMLVVVGFVLPVLLNRLLGSEEREEETLAEAFGLDEETDATDDAGDGQR